MRRRRSLRVQLTVAATLLVAVVVSLAGLAIAVRISHQDRAQVDRLLAERADKVLVDYGEHGTLRPGDERREEQAEPAGDLLAGSASFARLLEGTDVVAQQGDIPAAPIPVPDGEGLSTVTIDGASWRSLTVAVDGSPDTLLQVLQSLTSVEQRLADNHRLIAAVSAAAVAATALGAWFVVGLTLRPLERLRADALAVPAHGDRDLRLPVPRQPTEVSDLATTLNAMLTRLDASMHATRRFAADASHELRGPLTAVGFDLETLHAHPELPPDERAAILAAVAAQHERLTRLLDGLLALARGDANVLPARSVVHLSDIVRDSVATARARHPRVTVALDDQLDTNGTLYGWPEGVRLALDNLLDNAARHGRPDGHVEVTATRHGDAFRFVVADDGPGVPATERADLTRRFVRGQQAASNGSGLGLAITEQQAELHGGDLALDTSPSGGLAAILTLTASSPPATDEA